MADRLAVISVNASWNVINFRMCVIRALQREGFRVAVIAPADEYSARFESLGVDYYPIEIDKKGISPRRDLTLLRDFHRLLSRLRPAVFLGYTAKPNVYGSLAAHRLRIPVINNVSGLGTAFIGNPLLTRIVSTLYRLAFRRSATVFFQNADDRSLFVSKRLVREEQARLLPGSGIDLKRFAPAEDEGSRSAAPVRFILISRLLRDKGVFEYVEAARILKAEGSDAQFRLLGPTGAANRTAIGSDEVADWVRRGLIDYLGSTDDVRSFIADADCVVLPSYREGLPRILLEGAAMAKPLVATDVPGCRDVVQDGVNGLLCAARDAGSLAAAMRRMTQMTAEQRTQMGRSGRRMVEERFDERFIDQAYVDAVLKATAAKR